MKTLDSTHLYCDPPEVQPLSVDDSHELPSLKVIFGFELLAFTYPRQRCFLGIFQLGWYTRASGLLILTLSLFHSLSACLLLGFHGKPASGPGIGSVRQQLSAACCPIGCSDRFGGRSSCHHPVSVGHHPHVQVSIHLCVKPGVFLGDFSVLL